MIAKVVFLNILSKSSGSLQQDILCKGSTHCRINNIDKNDNAVHSLVEEESLVVFFFMCLDLLQDNTDVLVFVYQLLGIGLLDDRCEIILESLIWRNQNTFPRDRDLD